MKNLSIENKISSQLSQLFIKYGDNPEKLASQLSWLVFNWYVKGLSIKQQTRIDDESRENDFRRV